MKTGRDPLEAAPILYTVKDVAAILSISQARVRNFVHSSELKAIRLGVELRVRHEELERFLDANVADGKSPVRDGRRRGKKPGPKQRCMSRENNGSSG